MYQDKITDATFASEQSALAWAQGYVSYLDEICG